MDPSLSTPAALGAPGGSSGTGLEVALGSVRDTAARIRADYGNLESTVRWAMRGGVVVGGLAGAAAGYYLSSNLRTIRDAVNKVLSVAETVVRNGTPVLSLIDHSFGWVNTVKTPASDLLVRVDDFVNYDFASWSGPAAEVYKDKRTKQKDAVGEVVAKADFISSWLFKIVKGNIDYVQAILGGLGEIAGAFAAALVNAGTVINVLFAVDDIAEIVSRAVEQTIKALLLVVRRTVEALGDVRDLTSAVGDRSKLPGGNWPEAVRG